MKKLDIEVFQKIADLMEVPESEVIDNEDGNTVTIFGKIYMVIEFGLPRKNDDNYYKWAIFPI